jgi:hypothetical protein
VSASHVSQLDVIPVHTVVAVGPEAAGLDSTIVSFSGLRDDMRLADFQALKREQRGPNCLYRSEWAFPTDFGCHKHNVYEDRSLMAASQWCCKGVYGCPHGDCLYAFKSHSIYQARSWWKGRKTAHDIGPSSEDVTDATLLQSYLQPVYNRSDYSFSAVNYQWSSVETVRICPSAFALLVGCSSSTLQKATSRIKDGRLLNQNGNLLHDVSKSRVRLGERTFHADLLLSYIRQEVMKGGECNPAPGAHREYEVTVAKKSWIQRWADCQEHFAAAQKETPGNKKLFQQMWRSETRLRSRQQLTHAKCTTCKRADIELQRLSGNMSEEACIARARITELMRRHEKMHLAERRVLDDSGYLSLMYPRRSWTILCDAMTKRTTELPRTFGRADKAMSSCPKFSFHLMATYAYGFGFLPFLVHDSLKGGGNLTWTVLWLTLCRMRDHYGFWPDELHIQLDNTSGENKNDLMVAMCSWLVATGRVKRVRVFFLQVGHTHILIDMIFGIISRRIKENELVTPDDLIKNINTTLADKKRYNPSPVYWLRFLYDFKGWAEKQMPMWSVGPLCRSEQSDVDGAYKGMRDLVFSPHDGLAKIQYREGIFENDLAYRPDQGAAKTIKALPSGPPPFAPYQPYSQWGTKGSKTVRATCHAYVRLAKTLKTLDEQQAAIKAWDAVIDAVPSSADKLKDKIEFQHYDVLHATDVAPTPAPADWPPDKLDQWEGYRSFAARVFNVRETQLAYDPVVSTAQSYSEWEKARKAAQDVVRGDVGPHTCADAAELYLFLGDFIIAAPPTEKGVLFLYKMVAYKTAGAGALTDRAEIQCLRYAEKPNDDVSASDKRFWGTFMVEYVEAEDRQAKAKGVKRHQIREVLMREHIVVFNAQFMDDKQRFLSLDTLRALCRARPDMAMPDPIPASHIEEDSSEEEEEEDDDDGGAAAAAASAAGVAAHAGGAADSSEEEEDVDDITDAMPLSERAKTARAAAAAREADNDDDDEEELGDAVPPAGYKIIDECPDVGSAKAKERLVGKTLLLCLDNKTHGGWFMGTIEKTKLSKADLRSCSTANFAVKFTKADTGGKLEGSVASELTPRTHGAAEWWVLIEPVSAK